MSIKNSSIHLASEGNFDTVSTDSLAEMRSLVAEYAEDPNGAVLDDWEPREGTIITEVRAISARINQNYDAWPSEELREAHHTFIGKPVFVNHMNHDPDRARGRVVASRYVDAGEEDRYVQVLQEVEASRFPMLAKELMEGGLDSVSMGAEAREVECSYCSNISTSPFDACEHIPLKGSYLQRRTASGTPEDILVYEICRKISFFELSYVFDPADETAVASNVLVAGRREAVSEVEVPPKVDTLHPDEDEKSQDDWQEFVDDPNVIDTIDVLDEPDLGLNQELERSEDEVPEGFEEFADVDDRIEENEQAEKELAQDSREKSQEKAEEKAEKAQQQFEQAEPDPEDDNSWEDEDDGAGGTSSRFKGGGIEALVADDYGTFNMWVEKNGSLVASDSYSNFSEAKAAAVKVAKTYTKERKMNRNSTRQSSRKQAQTGQFQEIDADKEGFSMSRLWEYWPMFASGRGLVLESEGTFMWMIEDASGRYVKTEFSDSLQEAMQAVDDYYHTTASRKENKVPRTSHRKKSDKDLYVRFLEYAKNQGLDLEYLESIYYDDLDHPEVVGFEEAMYDFLQVDSVDDDPRLYTLLEAPGIYGISGHILGKRTLRKQAEVFAPGDKVEHVNDGVKGTVVVTDPSTKEVTVDWEDGEESTEPVERLTLAAFRKQAMEIWTDDICIDCLMILANDDDSGMSDEQAAESRAGIASLRAEGIEPVPGDFADPSFGTLPCAICGTRLGGDRVPANFIEGRSASRKRADDHLTAPGVDMSQIMLDGMGGYGDAVAVAFDSNGNAVDLALNWETAQSMANEGYNMQVLRGDGGKSQDEIQRMVDYEKELRRDLFGSRHNGALRNSHRVAETPWYKRWDRTEDEILDELYYMEGVLDEAVRNGFDPTSAENRIQELREELNYTKRNSSRRTRHARRKQANGKATDLLYDFFEATPGTGVSQEEAEEFVNFFKKFPDALDAKGLSIEQVISEIEASEGVDLSQFKTSRHNGSRRNSRMNDRDISRKDSRMAPQRRRRIGDNNKQTPLLEDTGIAQTPAEEPAVDVETGGDAPNNSESDRVKSARRALAREMARDRAIKARRRKQAYNGWSNWDTWNASLWLNNDQGLYNEALGKSASEIRALVEDLGVTGDGFDVDAVNWDEVAEGFNDEAHYARRRRQAAPVGADLSGESVDREDLFENYPATKMTANRVRNRFAAWAKENYGASLRQASGPGELRSWARAFAKESGIELQSLHTAIKRDVIALRTAADDDDKDDMPDFIEEKIESDDDNPSKEDVEDADDKKESARRRAAARRAAMQARRGRGRTKTTRRRTADDKLDLAAPDDRVNVEKPTSGTTDADAEASQFDKADFDNNSGKGLEDPDTTGTPGIPGGPSVNDLKKTSRATGLQAVRLAEAMITAGLIEDSTEAKFKAAAQFEKMSRDIVLDRTALLEKVATVHAKRRSSATKSAGNRGTSLNSAVPPNMTGMTRSSAPQTREASSANDSDLFF